MTDLSADLSEGFAPLASEFDRRRGGNAEFALRHRRPLVIGSLVLGDLISAIAVVIFTNTLLGQLIGAWPRGTGLAAVPLLIVLFWGAGLYVGSGPSPFERFRLRALAIAGLLTLDAFLFLPTGPSPRFFVAEIVNGIGLLVLARPSQAV